MDHEDPTLDVEAALRDEEELAVLAELGAASTAPDEEPSATPPGDAAASPGEPGSDSEKAPTGPPQKGRDKKGHYVYGVTHARLRERGLSLGLQPLVGVRRERPWLPPPGMGWTLRTGISPRGPPKLARGEIPKVLDCRTTDPFWVPFWYPFFGPTCTQFYKK